MPVKKLKKKDPIRACQVKRKQAERKQKEKANYFLVFSHFYNLEHINNFLSSKKIEKKFAFSKKVKRKQKRNFAFSKIFLRKQIFFSFLHIKTS